jgi:cbb3-type cytochrome oxidase subunit 3
MEQVLETLLPYFVWIAVPVAFVLLVIWIYRPGARRRYQQDAEIPFREDKPDRD